MTIKSKNKTCYFTAKWNFVILEKYLDFLLWQITMMFESRSNVSFNLNYNLNSICNWSIKNALILVTSWKSIIFRWIRRFSKSSIESYIIFHVCHNYDTNCIFNLKIKFFESSIDVWNWLQTFAKIFIDICRKFFESSIWKYHRSFVKTITNNFI